MYLMYHYSAFTSKELAQTDVIRHIWQYDVLDEAVKHPFLMHGILALSALHLADKDPESADEYLPLSIQHQNLAISAFRNALARITQDNCNAVFAQAAVVSMSCKLFSCIKARRHPPYMPSLEDIIEPYTLTRGVGEVVGVANHWLRKGPFAPMLQAHEIPEAKDFELPPSTISHFESMRDLFRQTVENGQELAALFEALAELERIYKETAYWKVRVHLNPGTMWKWPSFTPKEYMTLLRLHHPQALLVYAHFVMLSALHNTYWYFRDWGTQAVTVVTASLPPELQGWVQIPEYVPFLKCNYWY